MQARLYRKPSSLQFALVITFSTFIHLSSTTPSYLPRGTKEDLQQNYLDPAPAPEDGPPLSAGAVRDNTYLPAQIGGIVGSYAFSLVVVAALLLLLAKKRRKHLKAGEEDLNVVPSYQFALPKGQQANQDLSFSQNPPSTPRSPRSPIQNFSYPTPLEPTFEKGTGPYVFPAPNSSSTLGYSNLVDQRVVAADREMAQQQLEEMYRHVMEQEAAKEAGVTLDAPPAPVLNQPSSPSIQSKPGFLKKGRSKPANLDLGQPQPERQSRASSILSVLKSPRKKNVKGISISSPIMTPMSGTFPGHEGEEMNTIPPRHYAPASPPPVPSDQYSYLRQSRQTGPVAPLTPPDMSPESTMSIDERLRFQYGHSRNTSQAPTEADPVSATSERSNAPLIGLPSSPKPGVNRFPSLSSLPSSPKPGATFSRPNAPTAVRTGGALPLRAYEPALTSPSLQTTKQTTFERATPLSPSGLRTPWTGAPVPYTPYQPFSPVVPITPSLVTKADRKRMKQLQPKTPTMEMVMDSEEVW